jgi:spore coat protein U-like protein
MAAIGLAAAAGHAATTCGVTPMSMSLGTYYGDSAVATDSIGSLVVRCSRDGGPQNISITMALGASATSGSTANRRLLQVGGADMLAYNLYRDASRISVWGQATGVDTVTRNASIPNKSSLDVTFNIYGRIPGLQSVYAGTYTDSLLVTISY